LSPLKTLLVRIGVVAAVALGAAACTGGGPAPEREAEDSGAPVVQLGAPGETGTTLSPDEVEALPEVGHTAADIAFVELMVPHHEQALDMTALVPDRAGDRALVTLARRIEASQENEIEQLQDWLLGHPLDAIADRAEEGADDDHGEHSEGHSGGHFGGQSGGHGDHAGMPGMLTPEQLDEMAGLKGRAFDRYFLQAMIAHHDGAIRMVQTLIEGGEGGQEADLFQLASHIGSDQAVEIAAMKRRLSAMGG
jgi:uncharacterized protein (DUF305 family)